MSHKKYESHPKFWWIKRYLRTKNNFVPFNFPWSKIYERDEISKLNQRKACREGGIPIKIIKWNKHFFSIFYHNFINSLSLQPYFFTWHKKTQHPPFSLKETQKQHRKLLPNQSSFPSTTNLWKMSFRSEVQLL